MILQRMPNRAGYHSQFGVNTDERNCSDSCAYKQRKLTTPLRPTKEKRIPLADTTNVKTSGPVAPPTKAAQDGPVPPFSSVPISSNIGTATPSKLTREMEDNLLNLSDSE